MLLLKYIHIRAQKTVSSCREEGWPPCIIVKPVYSSTRTVENIWKQPYGMGLAVLIMGKDKGWTSCSSVDDT